MDKDTYIEWLESTLQEALYQIQDLYNSEGTHSRWVESIEDKLAKKKLKFEEDK